MKKLILTGFLAVFVFGCASTKVEQGTPVTDSQAAAKEVYKIGVGDGLSISVWRNPELSVSVPVRPDGMISVPLVGDIQAAGKQPLELAQILTGKLESFIRNPQVTVVVTNAASSEFLHRVRVTGAVSKPASLPYQKGMTILDVVLVSGGVTQFASPNDAKLYRVTPEGTKVYSVKLKDILEKGDIKTNYPLVPGDIVTVPERLF